MKKLITTTLVTIVISLCFLACGNTNTPPRIPLYQSMVQDISMSASDIEVEYTLKDEFFYKTDVPDKTYSFNGKEYNMSYESSNRSGLLAQTRDTYRSTNGEKFIFREDTGELVYHDVLSGNFFDNEKKLSDVDAPEDFALDFSREIAQKYVDNIDDYEQKLDISSEFKDASGQNVVLRTYDVKFTKKIQSYDTTDYVNIKITSKGHFASLSIGSLGVFDDFDIEIDKERLDQSVSDKLAELCKKHNYTLLSEERGYQRMHLVQNGDICIYTLVNISFLNSEGKEIKTAVCIETCVAKK